MNDLMERPTGEIPLVVPEYEGRHRADEPAEDETDRDAGHEDGA